MAFLSGFLVPLIEITFIMGVVGTVLYFVGKGMHNAWTKSWKFVWKYKIRKKEYPAITTDWIFSCVEGGIGWYQAKKMLMIKMTPQRIIDETLWIYDQIILELDKQKGGIKKYGKQFERGYCKEISEFPTVTKSDTSSNSSSNSKS